MVKNKSLASVKRSTIIITIGDVIELENFPGPIFEFYVECGCTSSQRICEKLNFLILTKATDSLAMKRLFFWLSETFIFDIDVQNLINCLY